jgi:hypothetical protein
MDPKIYYKMLGLRSMKQYTIKCWDCVRWNKNTQDGNLLVLLLGQSGFRLDDGTPHLPSLVYVVPRCRLLLSACWVLSGASQNGWITRPCLCQGFLGGNHGDGSWVNPHHLCLKWGPPKYTLHLGALYPIFRGGLPTCWKVHWTSLLTRYNASPLPGVQCTYQVDRGVLGIFNCHELHPP